MRVAMVGTGYVGLVSGVCFADFGHQVICLDKNVEKIARLISGKMPIYEPGLETLVQANVKAERLSFSTDLTGALANVDVVFIAVGTPSRRGDGHADLTFVYEATKEIGRALTNYTVIVTKSTVPVGTGDEVERLIREVNPAAEFEVVSNPEFLREGAAIGDFKRPDRIVIGAESERSRAVMSDLYRPLFLNQAPILFTSRRTAELTKYAANAFLATKVSFINEMSDLCEQLGADVQDVARGLGLDKRIGPKFLNAGPGYGGSCFPKDTLALVKTARDSGAPSRIVEAVVASNEARKLAMASKVVMACGGSVKGKVISLLGLAFKPNTDDMRDAPSVTIAHKLLEAGAILRVFDPESMSEARNMLPPEVVFCNDAYSCVEGASALTIVTEWDQFRALDLQRLKSLMKEPVIVDLRNIYRPDEMRQHGFSYSVIGKSAVAAE